MATGKRAGSRRAAARTPGSTPKVFAHAGGVTACVITWGYLVFSAVEFGGAARSGNSLAWILLCLAAIGAAASLFVGLMLVLRLLGSLGAAREGQGDEETVARPIGGRRAAR